MMSFGKQILGALALTTVAATSVAAADLPSRTAVPVAPVITPVSVFSWGGFYGGLRAGYGFGGDDDFGIRSSAGMLNRNAGDVGVRGGQFGGFLGYNWHMAGTPYVLGVEGDINGGRLSRSTSSPSISPFAASFYGRSSVDWNGSVRLRAGYAVDRALFYATGGVAFADTKYRASVGNNAIVWSNSDTKVGWTVGGGVDYAFNNNWFGGIEYRYTGFGKDRVTSTSGVYSTEASPSFHAITARVGYKF